ncbi:putative ribonuclease H-like domain-containing protein [Tanacetum coccineum]
MAGEDEFHDDNPPPPPPPPVTPTQQAPHTLSIIKLPILKKGVSTKDANQKFLRSLPASKSQVSLITRTKPGVDTLSFDDLYNNLRVFKSDVKGSTVSSSSTQNVAFVSSESTCSTNDVDEFDLEEMDLKWNQLALTRPRLSASIAITQGTLLESADQKEIKKAEGEMQRTLDIKQKTIGGDLENRRNLKLYNSGSNTEVTSCSKECEESYAKLKKLYNEQREQLGVASIEIQAYTQALKKVEAQLMSTKDKSGLGYGNQVHEGVLSYEKEVIESVFDSQSSDVEDSHVIDRFVKVEGMHAVPPPMIGIYMPSKSNFRIDESKFTYGSKQSKTCESDAKTSDTASCKSNSSVETHDSMPKPAINEPTTVNKSKVWYDAPIIEEYESDSDDEYVIEPSKEQEKPSFSFVNTVKHVKTLRETIKEQITYSSSPKANKRDWNGLMSKKLGLGYGFTKKACFVCGSFSHLIRDCDFHENRMAKQFVPKAVLTKTGIFLVNAARQNLSSQAVETSTARKVNTARPIMNEIRQRNNFYKSHSPIKRLFNKSTTPKANFTNHKVNTAGDKRVSAVGGYRKTAVKTSSCCNWRPKRHYWNKVSKYNSGSNSNKNDDPQKALKNKRIVDSGCSRNMIRNKAYLVEYQDYNGGPVAFGGGKGQITGKGKIITRKLDFEDVYFVKELKQFNLFSVSQICDKKNKVLVTDSECLVLSPNFKLPDENQATVDESNKWHRRLGHVNFKNLNKLVKGNLVRGLPSKIFQNDHTYVACQKGKQHKASCKAKVVSSISQPLQLLHKDLFGPTSVRSINHKTYCLVITDDFRRFSWVFFLRTKDETNGILKDLIRQIENQLNQKVKTIRCDNGTEFKNRDIIEFCESKGIKREYSNARTLKQNGVAKRKNRTLIEAARTMLADSFLPNTFWADAVNTACYVLNRVLVTKPQNKTPYELITGKIPIISYIRPFGCHVTILNTIDHLRKFEEKSNEGFLVGYSLNSKGFRVYNLETKRVEENLHINFLENKPNVAGKGPNWLFDLDYLTDSMNYQPITVENKANKTTGPKEANHSAVKSSEAKNGDKKPNGDTGTARATSTNTVNTVSMPISTASPSRVFSIGGLDLNNNDQDDSQIPALEDIYDNPSNGIFTNTSYDDEGAVADFTNLETTVNVSHIPTSRIHSIHPTTQILGDPTSAVQTRSKIKPKKISQAFEDESRYKHAQLNKKTLKEIQVLYIKEHERITDFVPIGSKEDERMIEKMNKKAAGVHEEKVLEEPDCSKVKESTRKRPGRRLKMKATKKSRMQKTDSDLEEEKDNLKTFLKLVPDEEGIIDYEVMEKIFPIINWESKFYHLDRHGAECIYYKIFRSDESSRLIKTFSEMVTMFYRLDLEELYNLVMQRFESTTPEGVDLVLWGDLRIMFDANTEDELWQNQERWNLKSWNFYENCGVHTLTLLMNMEAIMEVRRIFKCWIYNHTTNGYQFAPCYCNEALDIPEQTATGKEISNPFMNLQVYNKGAKDLIYGMVIPLEMMSDEIKASADYLNYLAKCMGTQPAKGQGKWLLSKKGVEVVMEKIETVRIAKKKRTEIVIKESGQSKEVAYTSDEGTLDHSKKKKGIKTLSTAAQYMLDMKTATKASKNDYKIQQHLKGPSEGSGVNPKVPESDDEKIEVDDSNKANKEKAKDDKPQVEKLAVQLLRSILTLSLAEYGNQFINDNLDVSLIDVLKDPAEIEIQSMVENRRSFLDHEKHLTLYNALINSMGVDEANVQGNKDIKKRRHDKQDPHADAGKDSKKRKRKDADTPSSKKEDEDLIQNDMEDDDMAADDMPHDDDAPTQDWSKWLKQDAMVRSETPDPEWYKEPNTDDALEHNMFNEMVNAEKDLVTFDDLMGSTIDFTKFAKHYQIDWANLEGDRCPYDLSKPLPLQGPLGRTTIPLDFFFNKDLEYLKTGNTEKNYASSLTKSKAARYKLEGLEEMILKL